MIGDAGYLEVSEEDLHYSARATNVQFTALGHLLRPEAVAYVPQSVRGASGFKRGGAFSPEEARKWLRNAWNTEAVLRQQLSLDEEAKRFALQWAFSQAYYACFCQVLAFFVASGQTQRSHSSVIKRFGELVRAGKYPPKMTWFADGGMQDIVVTGLAKQRYPSQLYLELDEPASAETQVAQFLKSTRERALKERKGQHKFKTASGRPRKNLTKSQWKVVSEALGPTSVLGLLYRKRIKANYREIDTFLRTEISGLSVLSGLINTVNAFALVHESLLASILTGSEYAALTSSAPSHCEFVRGRLVLARGASSLE